MGLDDWYRELFDERYLLFFEDVVQRGAAAEEIDFIDHALALPEGSRILDLGCGFGRHAIPMAERGYRVTGLDLSPRMLDVARRLAEQLHVSVDWVERDLRDLSELGPFEGCVCLYTAFGYFSDQENLGVLSAVRDVLARDGRLRRCLARGGWPTGRGHLRRRGREPHLVSVGGVPAGGLSDATLVGRAPCDGRRDGRRRADALVHR